MPRVKFYLEVMSLILQFKCTNIGCRKLILFSETREFFLFSLLLRRSGLDEDMQS